MEDEKGMEEEQGVEEEKEAQEEKGADEVVRWKGIIAARPDDAGKKLDEIPHDVMVALVNDPEVGPALQDAITGLLPDGQETAESVQKYIDTEGAAEEAAPTHGESAAASAARARKQRDERGEKEAQAKKLSLLARILKLDVGERAKLARTGDQDCRTILIKDSNKVVSIAVLSNPKITTHEIELVAASRNVNEDILRAIGGNRDWCKSYSVMLALVNNPKTPVGVSLTHLAKIFTRDLRVVSRSKGVPDAIRVSAKRLAQKRSI